MSIVMKPILFRGEIRPPYDEELKGNSKEQINWAACMTTKVDPLNCRIDIGRQDANQHQDQADAG